MKQWLRFLLPKYYRTMRYEYNQLKVKLENTEKENRKLKDQYKAEREGYEQLKYKLEEFSREHNDLLSLYKAEQEKSLQLGKENVNSLAKAKASEEAIAKLKSKLEIIRLEREEVYSQYNRLFDKLTQSSVTVSVSADLPLRNDNLPSSIDIETSDGLKLNVGCGRVKKAGYLNVDIDPSVKPDLILNISSILPFKDEKFQVIEAYHIIEHIFPWLIQDLLKDFFRVLKPQGRLIIECPNIEAACTWLVGNMQYGWNSQMGMWALYGDPNPENPFHMHKWGYTPLTLSDILRQAGFTNITREIPQTHVARRDMRMIAIKPNFQK